jgi:hypothetical protein
LNDCQFCLLRGSRTLAAQDPRSLHRIAAILGNSEDRLTEHLKELGMYDLGRKMLSLQPLNRWLVEQFRDLWRRSGLTVELLDEFRGERFIEIVERVPTAFQGRGLTMDDMAIHGLQANAIP